MYVIQTKYGYVKWDENGVTYRYVPEPKEATQFKTSQAAMDKRPNSPNSVKPLGNVVLPK